MESLILKNIHLIRLRGTQQERAQQHGRLIANLSKDEQKKLAFTPLSKKNQVLIRRATQRLPGIGKLFGGLYEAIVLERFLRLPKVYRQRIEPFAKASKIPLKKIWLALYQPDLLMVLAASSSPKTRNRFLEGLPGCSTVRIFNHGNTYFLRNLDYPAVSYWEKNQAVFYHEPTEPGAQKYLSVSSLGIQLAGLTGWNASGIALSLHAHFSKKVSMKGVPIFFLGEEILEKATSLDEAIQLCERFHPIGSWALNLTSFKENRSVTLELVHGRIHVREPDHAGGIAHSNFFQAPEFKKDELHFSGAFFEDSEARKLRLDQTAKIQSAGFDWPHALTALGSHLEPNTGKLRVFGNITSVITNIQSCGFDPVENCLYLSTRAETPVGLGPYLKLPFDFDKLGDPAPETLLELPDPLPSSFLKALHFYSQAYVSWQVHHEEPKVAHSFLIQATEAYPNDPHLLMQRGYFELIDRQADQAFHCFDRALKEDLSEHLYQVALYFRGCSLDLLGQRDSALKDYQSILAFKQIDDRLGNKVKKRLNRPYQASYCQRIEPDLQFVEPLNYP